MGKNINNHFTATVYLLHQNKLLLLFHPKFNKWLPPGGHLEAGESPVMAAKREVFEETGLDFIFLRNENIWIDRPNVKSFERPYLCLVEQVPEHQGVCAHQHFDFIYVGKPLIPFELVCKDNMRWFTLEEINGLKSDDDVFVEIKQIAKVLLSKQFSLR